MDVLARDSGHQLLERIAPTGPFGDLANPQFIPVALDRNEARSKIGRQKEPGLAVGFLCAGHRLLLSSAILPPVVGNARGKGDRWNDTTGRLFQRDFPESYAAASICGSMTR